jgi:hypothetical protein
VKGEATVFPKPGKSFDPALIPKAIHDAGFTATEVEVVADGTLEARNGSLVLDAAGLNHPFILAGGAQEVALRKQEDLVGRRICVAGKLSLARDGRPPTLSVDSFHSSPKNLGNASAPPIRLVPWAVEA